MIEIDELVEIWIRVHEEARHDDLSWWREAFQCLRPTPEDSEILEDEESGRQTN